MIQNNGDNLQWTITYLRRLNRNIGRGFETGIAWWVLEEKFNFESDNDNTTAPSR